jgi:hypothetical protein
MKICEHSGVKLDKTSDEIDLERAASEYKDRVGTNYSGEYIIKDFKAGWDARDGEVARLRAALESICGNRCAQGINPCEAREALDE